MSGGGLPTRLRLEDVSKKATIGSIQLDADIERDVGAQEELNVRHRWRRGQSLSRYERLPLESPPWCSLEVRRRRDTSGAWRGRAAHAVE